MNEETSPEDLTILAALATLEPLDETPGGTPDARPAHVNDTSEMPWSWSRSHPRPASRRA